MVALVLVLALLTAFYATLYYYGRTGGEESRRSAAGKEGDGVDQGRGRGDAGVEDMAAHGAVREAAKAQGVLDSQTDGRGARVSSITSTEVFPQSSRTRSTVSQSSVRPKNVPPPRTFDVTLGPARGWRPSVASRDHAR